MPTSFNQRIKPTTNYNLRSWDVSNLYYLIDNLGNYITDNLGNNIIVPWAFYLQDTIYNLRIQP